MRLRVWGVAAATLMLASAMGPTAQAATKLEPLNQYVVSGGDQSKLGELGYDVTEGGSAKGRIVVGTPEQADALRA